MHSYLITGLTKSARASEAEKFLAKAEIKEILKLKTDGKHSIEDIRDLTHLLSLSPANSDKGRGVVIFDADRLTPEAANAFLKTLEDPPGKTIIILTAPNSDLVLETIVSRAKEINIGPQELDLTDSEREETLEMFKKLRLLDLGEKLKFADEIGDRNSALNICERLIWAGHHLLVKESSPKQIKTLAGILGLLEQVQQDLENNVNTKLTLGNFLLKMHLGHFKVLP